jgi:hypothetical protein
MGTMRTTITVSGPRLGESAAHRVDAVFSQPGHTTTPESSPLGVASASARPRAEKGVSEPIQRAERHDCGDHQRLAAVLRAEQIGRMTQTWLIKLLHRCAVRQAVAALRLFWWCDSI